MNWYNTYSTITCHFVSFSQHVVLVFRDCAICENVAVQIFLHEAQLSENIVLVEKECTCIVYYCTQQTGAGHSKVPEEGNEAS